MAESCILIIAFNFYILFCILKYNFKYIWKIHFVVCNSVVVLSVLCIFYPIDLSHSMRLLLDCSLFGVQVTRIMS